MCIKEYSRDHDQTIFFIFYCSFFLNPFMWNVISTVTVLNNIYAMICFLNVRDPNVNKTSGSFFLEIPLGRNAGLYIVLLAFILCLIKISINQIKQSNTKYCSIPL